MSVKKVHKTVFVFAKEDIYVYYLGVSDMKWVHFISIQPDATFYWWSSLAVIASLFQSLYSQWVHSMIKNFRISSMVSYRHTEISLINSAFRLTFCLHTQITLQKSLQSQCQFHERIFHNFIMTYRSIH